MITTLINHHHSKSTVFAAGFGLLALFGVLHANAGCMDNLLPQTLPSEPYHSAQFVPAVYRPGNAMEKPFLNVNVESNRNQPIVGLWEFQFNGFSPDFGTQAWHEDGTEIMFSGGQNPATGDVCQGIWSQTGKSSYSLNHIATSYVDADHRLRIHIHAQVTVDNTGNYYSGQYTADVYAVTTDAPFEENDRNLVASGSGDMWGTRVNPE